MKPRLVFAFGVMALPGLALTGCAQFGMGTDAGQGAGVEVAGERSVLFDALDDDGNGTVSRDELLTYFRAHDISADGELDAGEFAAFESPGLVGPGHPGEDAGTEFPEPLESPSPPGPEVARPPAAERGEPEP